MRRIRHGKAESKPNLKAFRTRFCLTLFIWNSAFITGSSLCLKISLKTFNNYSPVTLAHEQRFNHMSLNSKIKTYRLFNSSHNQLGLPVSLPDYLYRFNQYAFKFKTKTKTNKTLWERIFGRGRTTGIYDTLNMPYCS